MDAEKWQSGVGRLTCLALLTLGCGRSGSVLDSNPNPTDASTEVNSTRGAGGESNAADSSLSAATDASSDQTISQAALDAAEAGADASTEGGEDTTLMRSDASDASEAGRVVTTCRGLFEWQGVNTDATGVPLAVAVGELNGDGIPDLVVIKSPNGSQTGVVKVALSNLNGTFDAFVDFGVGASPPTSVVTADVNADGRLDLLVTNGGDGTVSVLLNTTPTGAAAPSFASKVDFAADTGASSVAIGDFNGDARPDLAVANPGAGTLSVLLNTTFSLGASPSFDPKIDFAAGTKPSSIAVADINTDGRPDILVTDQSGGKVSVLLNETVAAATTLVFGAKTDFAAGLAPAFVTAGDLNGDGKPDLAVASHGESSVSVFFNTTPSASATPTMALRRPFAVSGSATSIVLADLNGDAKPDLAVGNDSANSVSILFNTTPAAAATASFAVAFETSRVPSPHAVAASDLDGDGRPDLVIAGGLINLLLVHNTTLTGASTPHFGSRWDVSLTGSGVSNDVALATTDINGDGKPDLVAAGFGQVLLLNTTPNGALAPTFTQWGLPLPSELHAGLAAGDLNGDGKPDLVGTNNNGMSVVINTTMAGSLTPTFANSVDFLAGTGLAGVTMADVNTDGKLDVVMANPAFLGSVSVFINTTLKDGVTPTFAPKVDLATTKDTCGGLSPYHARLADLNGDGKPDLVIALPCGPFDVRLNTTPTGSLTPSFGPQIAVNGSGLDVALGDLDGDGRPDILAAGGAFLNTTPIDATTATFGAGIPISMSGTYGVAIADLNGDGKPDVAWADFRGFGGYSLNHLSQDAGASFGNAVSFAVGKEPYSVVAADFNGDGKSDLAFNPRADNSVTVLMSGCPP